MNKSKIIPLVFMLLAVSLLSTPVHADMATASRGKIFLQIEAHGEAWYVNPLDSHRYFLGRPSDAFAAMRAFGLGISNKDFNSWKGYGPTKLSGRILLKVEDSGKAYYVNPKNLQLLYLGSPTDAFAVMRQAGVGITNANLSLIPVEFNLPIVKGGTITPTPSTPTVSPYPYYMSWTYKQKTYSINLNLDANLYQSYLSSPKDYTYRGMLPLNWRESYYKMFLTPKTSDNSISILADQFRSLAKSNSLSDDELVELVVAFVQAIPYDYNRSNAAVIIPNYPYEVLYKKLGICSDKTLLGMMLLRNLGYGVADLDYPEKNHAGLGIACTSQYALYDKTYCFAEMTNFLPIGFIPQNLNSTGVAIKPANTIVGQFDNVFDVNSLGKVEIYQKTQGKVYGGIVATYKLVDKLKSLEADITASQKIIDGFKQQVEAKLAQVNSSKQQLANLQAQGNTSAYNQLVPQYNQLVKEYYQLSDSYQIKIVDYNSQSSTYNQGMTDLYKAGK